MEFLLDQADKSLKTWQRIWSPFVSAPLKQEALRVFSPLNDLACITNGGYPGAERHRISFSHCMVNESINSSEIPIKGLNIMGNFLFDRAKTKDFHTALTTLGASHGELGDIWLNGDRGANAICTEEFAKNLEKKEAMVRDIKIRVEVTEINELNLPIQRQPKTINTVEASTRLDAIASAGFGVSRAKIIKHIKNEQIRINWEQTTHASRHVYKGDILQLEGRGSIEVLSIQPTKRSRWRVELMRR